MVGEVSECGDRIVEQKEDFFQCPVKQLCRKRNRNFGKIHHAKIGNSGQIVQRADHKFIGMAGKNLFGICGALMRLTKLKSA